MRGPPRGSYADLFQIAYVTRDIEAAVATLSEAHGVTGWVVRSFTLSLDFPPGATVLKVALAWAGEHEIELIQPVEDAARVFAPALPDPPNALAFHHLCMRVPGSLENWERFRSGIADEKVAIAGGREGMRFIYVDERATLGHYLEYFWSTAEFLQAHPHRLPPADLKT